MADYNIFREQMGIRFPTYGHALWDSRPEEPGKHVKMGDVGFIRGGKFHRLFNALSPEGEQLPSGFQQLVPKSPHRVSETYLNRGRYCSNGIRLLPELDHFSSGPDDPKRVLLKYSGNRGGAALSLPVNARREDTLAKGAFGEWIVKNIDRCFALTQDLQLGIEQMEEIVLVTGCDRTRSWTNVAFLGGGGDAEASFGERVFHRPDNRIDIRFSDEHAIEAVLNLGPEGSDLPENQCVFIRGFRVARTLWKFPRRLKAAAGPSTDRYDREPGPDTELISIPATTKYRDLLHILLDFIAERALDCDMVLVHDDDLELIHGINEGSSFGSLQPDVVMDVLRRSNIEIHEVCCDLSPIGGGPNTEAGVVQVAMLPKLSQDWSIVPLSQEPRSTPQDPDFDHMSPLPTTVMADSKMFYKYVPSTIQGRKRTSPAQLAVLEDAFVTDKKPNMRIRGELARKLNLSPREVQVWFQNRRAKEKLFSNKYSSPTSPKSSTGMATLSATSTTTDVSSSPEATPEDVEDPAPPPSDTSPITKIEPQTPESSTLQLLTPPPSRPLH